MAGKQLIHFKVTGTVQGVNFRSYTKRQAEKLNLRGWVTNKADSSVEGVAVGYSENIDAFRKHLDQGPSAARVKNVELIRNVSDVSEETVGESLGSGSGFEIR